MIEPHQRTTTRHEHAEAKRRPYMLRVLLRRAEDAGGDLGTLAEAENSNPGNSAASHVVCDHGGGEGQVDMMCDAIGDHRVKCVATT